MNKKIKNICIGLLLVSAMLLTACFDNFTPKLPVPLSEEMKLRVKQDYFDTFVKDKYPYSIPYPYLHAKLPSIMYYWGTYDGNIVLTMDYDYKPIILGSSPYEIAGVEFKGVNFDTWVWREGFFYSLQDAFEKDLLTQEDIQNIAELHDKRIDLKLWYKGVWKR